MAAFVVFGSIAPGAAQAAEDDPSDDAADVLTDRLLASLEGADLDDRVDILVTTSISGEQAAEKARDMGHDIRWTFSIIDAYASEVRVGDLAELAEKPWVEAVWDDRPMQTNLEHSTAVVQADAAWNAGITGDGVSVAVIDTGVDMTDPTLAGNLEISACSAFFAGVKEPECMDTDGHGTHVAGIVASSHPTYTGVAPDASIAAFRTLHGGAGLSSDSIAALDWIVNNPGAVTPAIEVINMSLGPLNPGCGDGTSPSAQAADAAVDAGFTVAVASGNAGHDECTVDGAAAGLHVVAVGSVDDQDTTDRDDVEIAGSSSAGPTEDNRAKPEVVAPGAGITSLHPGPILATLSGTSMAAPHVAGAAALVNSAHANVDPHDLRHAFMDTAHNPPNAPSTLPQCDSPWGWGLIDIDALLTAIDGDSWQTPTDPCGDDGGGGGDIGDGNDPQSGEARDCSDFFALFVVPGVHSPLATTVDADAGTWFKLTNPSDAFLYVDFYDSSGESVGVESGSSPLTGEVPDQASYGIVCVDPIFQALTMDPRFTYQDGFTGDPA